MGMFTRTIITPAIVAATAFLATHATGTDPASQMAAAAPTPTPTLAASVDPVDLAGAYAGQHGLTSCDAPEDASLDDVFLATSLEEPGAIVVVDLDTALASAGKRQVLLACQD